MLAWQEGLDVHEVAAPVEKCLEPLFFSTGASFCPLGHLSGRVPDEISQRAWECPLGYLSGRAPDEAPAERAVKNELDARWDF